MVQRFVGCCIRCGYLVTLRGGFTAGLLRRPLVNPYGNQPLRNNLIPMVGCLCGSITPIDPYSPYRIPNVRRGSVGACQRRARPERRVYGRNGYKVRPQRCNSVTPRRPQSPPGGHGRASPGGEPLRCESMIGLLSVALHRLQSLWPRVDYADRPLR